MWMLLTMTVCQTYPYRSLFLLLLLIERTALHLACHYGKMDAVKLLLSHGADHTLKDNSGMILSGLIHSHSHSQLNREATH